MCIRDSQSAGPFSVSFWSAFQCFAEQGNGGLDVTNNWCSDRLVAVHFVSLDAVSYTHLKFVTEPIAKAFGVDHLIAALPEETDSGEFTGGLIGAPTSGEGKIAHTENWLRQMNLSFDSFDDTYFYSDSDRDLPLLSKVNHPVAVNPNSRLTEYARTQGWPLMHLFHD